MKKLLVCIFALFMSVHAGEISSREYHISSGNTDKIFQDLIKWAESQNGYFTQFNNNMVFFNLPKEALQAFEDTLAKSAEITDKNYYSNDRSAELETYNLQLQTRRELMEKFMEIVKNSSFEQLQSVEREIADLTATIERLEGQKRKLQAETSIVSVKIYATKQIIRPLQQTYTSPFNWINNLGINKMQGAF